MRARGADWLVTALRQSANASQSGDSMGDGPPCCDFSGGFLCRGSVTPPQTVKILKVTKGGGEGSDSRVDPGGGWGQAQTSRPFTSDLQLAFFPKSRFPLCLANIVC